MGICERVKVILGRSESHDELIVLPIATELIDRYETGVEMSKVLMDERAFRGEREYRKVDVRRTLFDSHS